MKGRLQLLRTYPEVAVALSWVVVSRATLWLIGLVSREVLQPFLPQQEPGAPFTENPFLAVWGHWDTRWYLDIARRGYSPERLPYTGEANYAFFPLYPLLMRALGPVVGDVYLAGIVVSNLYLVAAAVLLYRLARLDGDELAAERSVKYLVLLPTAFVFSAVLTEALFVALSVAAFLQARRDRWWAAGVLGGLAALTRPNGVLLVLPLAWMCFAGAEGRTRWASRVAALSLVPLGLGMFCFYNWLLTGDLLAFVRVQQAWLRAPANPVEVLLGGVSSPVPQLRVGAWFAVAVLVLSFAFARTLGFPYFLVCLSAVLLPLGGGWVSLFGQARYVLSAWPLALLLARLGSRADTDALLTASLALLQGFLMVFWSNGSRMVI